MSLVKISAVVAVASLALVACSKDESGGGASSSTAAVKADVAKARAVFSGRCVACHGTTGKGDGPGAAALKPKPRAFGDKVWQKSVTDDDISKTILAGGLAVGKSAIMPGNPDLKGKPEVVAGLVKLIRAFGK